jgi:hypothetical protein
VDAPVTGTATDRSAIPETYSTRRTRSVLIQISNPQAQSGMATQARKENRRGLLTGSLHLPQVSASRKQSHKAAWGKQSSVSTGW